MSAGTAVRVLYVDRGRISTILPQTLLDEAFELVRAETATDAVKRLHHEAVDAVVVPTDLPELGLDGFADLVADAAPGVQIVAVGEAKSPPEGVLLLPPSVSARTLHGRLRSALLERRIDSAIASHHRLESTTLDVLRAALDADSPDAVASMLYDRLTDGYEFVVVGRATDDGLDVDRPLRGRFTLDEFADAVGADDGTFLERAIADRAVVVAGPTEVRGGGEATGTAAEAAVEATTDSLRVAAVPLATAEWTYGVLLVGTRRPDAFDGTERAVLERLGTLVGHAMAAIEGPERERVGSDRLEGVLKALAHEIRNPLQVATTALGLAREGDEEAFSTVADAHERIERTVESVLTLVAPDRLEAVDEIDLQELVLSVWEDVRSESAELTIAGLPTVEADRGFLERLLSNLLRNAVEHAGPDVSVRVGALAEGAGFYVEDDGPGIPPDRRERIFEWGVSGEAAGTGIGLALVREICDAHGWGIHVTEGREGGARFEVVTEGVEEDEPGRSVET